VGRVIDSSFVMAKIKINRMKTANGRINHNLFFHRIEKIRLHIPNDSFWVFSFFCSVIIKTWNQST